MIEIKTGQIVRTLGLIFKSYDLNRGVAEMLLPQENDSPKTIYLPLTMAEFELGMYGANSWVHPTDLPPSHPNFVTWKIQAEKLVTHNRTGEVCYLLLTKEFHSTGEFQLTPKINQRIEKKHSIMHTPLSAKQQLESLKGKTITFKVRILCFLVNDQVEASILFSKSLSKKDVSIVGTSIPWMSLAALPLEFFILVSDAPSTRQKQKWKKRASSK